MYRDNTVKKIEDVQYQFSLGKTREEVAGVLGYPNVHALNQFASRSKLSWNNEKNNYDAIGNDGEPIEAVKTTEHVPTGKAANIISMFESGMDGRDVAKKLRFDMQQMAEYMRKEGYIWNDDKHNYVHHPQEIKTESQEAVVDADIDDKSNISTKKAYESTDVHEKTLEPYMDVLVMLSANKDRLAELINTDEQSQNTAPKYIISGNLISKCLRINNNLDELVKDYCHDNNIHQQDFFQCAIIEHLKKYGYAERAKAYLKV